MRTFLFVALTLVMYWAQAQDLTKQDEKTFEKAYGLFLDDSFSEALILFDTLVQKHPENFDLNYYLGACYLNTRYSKDKAIPYLKKALTVGEDKIPDVVHKDLGDLYHLTYNFKKAISHFNRYIKLAPNDDIFIPHAHRMLITCANAEQLMQDTINVSIQNLGLPINSEDSEFAPYISADDSVLFFTYKQFYTDELLATIENPDTLSKLFVSTKQKGIWSKPKMIEISGLENESDVSIAGLSPDGEFLYINAMNGRHQDIYAGRYFNDEKLELKALPEPVNSEYWEGKVTLSAQGDFIWFTSDRLGGFGGKDIYKCERLDSNQWGEPINIGETINTPYNEDAPFLHPSGNIFYFSSNGHKSIGGYDVFSILLSDNQVFPVENMGFPINTTSDDMYFVLSGSGKYGYFSSAYGNKYGNHDIYRIEMDMNIPLTIIKGTILAGDPAKPVGAKIRVLDLKTGQKLKYVYNPNPKTGRYLLILPPGKDYTMIIESDQFMPQSISLQLPEQKEFFELFQSIHLMPVMSLGQQVGEQVHINNTFSSSSLVKVDSVDMDNTDETIGFEKDYNSLFSLIDKIITTTDTINNEAIELRGLSGEQEEDKSTESFDDLFSLIDEAFEHGNTETLNKIQDNTIIPDKFEQVFLYSEKMEQSKLNKVVIGNDTVYTTPQLMTFNTPTIESTKQNDLIGVEKQTIDSNKMILQERPKVTISQLRNSIEYERRIIITHSIYFRVNQFECNKNLQNEMKELAKLLINNEELGLIISGYTDISGDYEYNKALSKKRSFRVAELLKDYGVNTRRAIIKSFGEDLANNIANKNDRRVDVTIFELKSE